MTNNLISIIHNLNVPKVILRFVIMNFLDLPTIKNLLLTVKEMNVLDDYSKDLLLKANNGFSWNCKYGHLTVAKWLYSFEGMDRTNPYSLAHKRQSNVNIYDFDQPTFILSSIHGHLAVTQWVFFLSDDNFHADDYAFKMSCVNDHLAVAQWIYSLDYVNIHDCNEFAFRMSCAGGHLTVAQWLYSLGGVDIHADNDYALRWSCNNGHLPVAQWLYSLGYVGIHANEHIFKYAKSNILNWLNNLIAKN